LGRATDLTSDFSILAARSKVGETGALEKRPGAKDASVPARPIAPESDADPRIALTL
jgi:hypothetical protein